VTDTALGQRSFRDVLGRFPTGVVVIAARTPAGPLGWR
jgi:flavin reductase (DIM6/NTAB) family NADH-FMN oxidoreductase RutF